MFVKNIRKAAVVSSIAILLAAGMIGMLSFSFAEDENDEVLSVVTALGGMLNPLFSTGTDDAEIAGVIMGEEAPPFRRVGLLQGNNL